MEIKDKLKAKRQEAGLTQKELAAILHVSRQTISSWEVGRTYPDLEILVTISELYKTPLDDLLKEDSKMVEDITNKVKTSQRRKTTIIILAVLLFFMTSFSIYHVTKIYQANQINAEVNEAGLSPNDLLNSYWEINFAPTNEISQSRLSFGEEDLVILNEHDMISWLTPDSDPAEVEEIRQKWIERGLEDGIVKYNDLKVAAEDDKYIVTAYGYSQKFTKLSDTIIRDENGIEYYNVATEQMHDSLYWIAEQLGIPSEESKLE
ncbi:helix-turn-helix transcriptional regulator [Desemzia sp. RIT804]|uniref:helix-turn-helix transcriptional regulator n=1 Tax=Desemzia sp. RIT 804 TaxID=2810209 RepID=UPI00194F7D5B|nr:helix-turn-helix transcriptional regulator [Desemzia sp. RIT 804]MBM6615181.1 helix-turn-helix transcriptional regulator [Desemzia sp. RIT 804]